MSRAARAAWVEAEALLALAPAGAWAASTRTLSYQFGGYAVTVTEPEPAQVETQSSFRVRVAPAGGVSLRAITRPGFGTPASPVRAQVRPGGPGEFAVSASFPVRGAWTLWLLLSAPSGTWQVGVPVTVAAPGAIPTWLGWTIGLFPLLVLAVFLAFQVRYAGRLSAAAAARGERGGETPTPLV